MLILSPYPVIEFSLTSAEALWKKKPYPVSVWISYNIEGNPLYSLEDY
jgi:hypothetical protein